MLVILDEPTLGLHPGAQAGMAEVLEELRALGNTLLVVEHDPPPEYPRDLHRAVRSRAQAIRRHRRRATPEVLR